MFESVQQENRLGSFDQQLNQKRQVKLKTCADVYDYWRTCKRLYRKAPKEGVEFQVDYIDTGLALSEAQRAKAPIALALHGAPGSYHDFALLIRHLSQQSVRVIAPNFPEYTATVKTKVLFRHSADEKAAYLRDFLKAINVNKIDLLVSHSSAIFPTLLILLNANNKAIESQQKRKQQEQASQKSIQLQDNGNCKQQVVNNVVSSIKDELASVDEARDTVEGGDSTDLGGVNKQLYRAANEDNEEVSVADDECIDDDNREEDEEDEEFEDAKDEVDPNNNSNISNSENMNIATKESTRENNNQVACESNQRLDSNQSNDGNTDSNKKKNKRNKKRDKRQDQDVIVKFDQPIEIKAVALFNPAGHRLPKSMKPTWFKCGSVRIYQHKLGRSLFRKLGPAFLTVVGVPVRVDNMDNVMLSATVMRNSKCQRVVQQLEQLSQMKLPTLLVFSENDKLIEKEIFYEMSRFMKLDHKNFDIFNNDGDIELSQSRTEDWIRVMVFKAGGHYAYSNYAKTVNKAVSELLKKVVKEEPSKIVASS